MFNRNEVLKDLRHNVIEITFNEGVVRLTLKPDLLPKRYIEEDYKEEKKFHEENKKLISAFNVMNAEYFTFDIANVRYVQIIDGY
jgi:hypothetical protein